MFLHFDSCELERLVPDLRDYEVDRELRLDPRASLDVAMILERRAAEFFRDYADKFLETEGRRIFEEFAAEEQKHYESIRRRAEGLLATI